MNRLYFGDNLKWLSDRKEFPDASVDLIYLDPPFNSNADYSVLFRERTVEGPLNGTEHIDAPPQLNPFAMAARESAREKQTELL